MIYMWDVKELYPSDPVNALHSVISSVKSKYLVLSSDVLTSSVYSYTWLLFHWADLQVISLSLVSLEQENIRKFK